MEIPIKILQRSRDPMEIPIKILQRDPSTSLGMTADQLQRKKLGAWPNPRR